MQARVVKIARGDTLLIPWLHFSARSIAFGLFLASGPVWGTTLGVWAWTPSPSAAWCTPSLPRRQHHHKHQVARGACLLHGKIQGTRT